MAQAQHAAGPRSVGAVHGEVVTDRQDAQLGLVQLADQSHVHKQRSIAGDVDLKTVLQLQDVANRQPAVDDAVVAGKGRRVAGFDHRGADAGHLDRAAQVEADDVAHAAAFKPAGQVEHTQDRRRVLDGGRGGVGDVVEMPVGYQDRVDASLLTLVVGAARVLFQERVDQQRSSAGGLDAKGGMAQPGDLGVLAQFHGFTPNGGGPRPSTFSGSSGTADGNEQILYSWLGARGAE